MDAELIILKNLDDLWDSFIMCRYQKLVEGGLGNHGPQQESPLKYVPINNDESVGKFELERRDAIDHVL